MDKNIIAISHCEDPHLSLVNSHLSKPLFVIDPREFTEKNLTYLLKNGKFSVVYDDIELIDITSVWYRKPCFLTKEEYPVEQNYKDFAYDSYERSIKAIYDLFRDKFWLSDYRHIIKAENKLYQLEIASEIGFKVPETILTNNPSEAQSFRGAVGNIITKSLSAIAMHDGDDLLAFFTTSINLQDKIDFEGLSVAPAMFQREIKNKTDLRITFVGDKYFACVPRLKNAKSHEIDWRIGITNDRVQYDVYNEVPNELIKKCRELLKVLGLSFGAIEFAIDEEGNYWFLEINPNGQWAFVELETGLQIGAAIAELLESGGHTSR